MLNRLTVSTLLKAVIAITSVCVVIALSLTAYGSWERLKTANRYPLGATPLLGSVPIVPISSPAIQASHWSLVGSFHHGT